MAVGESVLITGGSSGIGWAAAELLARKGCRVFATTRSLEKRRDVIELAARKYGPKITFVEMEATSDESVERCVATVIGACRRIDSLVCNAGIAIIGSIEETPISLVRAQIDVNLLGYIRTLQAVVPHMRGQGGGRIVLVGSLAAILAIPYQSHYSMSKAAVEALAEGLRSLRHLPAHSPYGRWSARAVAAMDRGMAKAPFPEIAARKIHRILSVRHPRRSYTVADFVGRLAPLFLPWFPRGLKEKIVRMFYDVDFS